MSQHAGLSRERWERFSVDQQVLMIANEMNRAAKLMDACDRGRCLSAYERILQLTDLTIDCGPRWALRRELLRWRDLVAALYIGSAADPGAHRATFRALLRLTPETSKQLALLDATRERQMIP
jgi:hypothetical protein